MSIGIVIHFYNEEFLLPFWIEQHKLIADEVIFINHQSTDKSLEIIRDNILPGWKVVDSTLNNFDASQTDVEAIYYERSLKTDIKIILNATEFLFADKNWILEWFAEHGPDSAARVRSISMIDNHFIDGQIQMPLDKYLWKNINYGSIFNFDDGANFSIGDRLPRFMHSCATIDYDLGRHRLWHNDIRNMSDAFILWFGFAPWPNVIDRKLQIQQRMPESDKIAHLGIQHIVDEEKLNEIHSIRVQNSTNLFNNVEYKKIYNKLLEVVK
jgi:hypothetical protein